MLELSKCVTHHEKGFAQRPTTFTEDFVGVQRDDVA